MTKKREFCTKKSVQRGKTTTAEQLPHCFWKCKMITSSILCYLTVFSLLTIPLALETHAADVDQSQFLLSPYGVSVAVAYKLA